MPALRADLGGDCVPVFRVEGRVGSAACPTTCTTASTHDASEVARCNVLEDEDDGAEEDRDTGTGDAEARGGRARGVETPAHVAIMRVVCGRVFVGPLNIHVDVVFLRSLKLLNFCTPKTAFFCITHTLFFFVNMPMCLLSHALVILVTYRDKGLPQLPKPGDFMKMEKEVGTRQTSKHF